MKKKLIFGISLSVIISIVATITVLLFSIQILTMVFCKVLLSDRPVVYQVPEKIVLGNYAFTNSTKFSCFNYHFELPWADVKEKIVTQSLAIVSFESGVRVIFFHPNLILLLCSNIEKKMLKQEKLIL